MNRTEYLLKCVVDILQKELGLSVGDKKQIDGKPCKHDNCLKHVSHYCETCKRVAGQNKCLNCKSWGSCQGLYSCAETYNPIIKGIGDADECKHLFRPDCVMCEFFDYCEQLVEVGQL